MEIRIKKRGEWGGVEEGRGIAWSGRNKKRSGDGETSSHRREMIQFV